MKLAVLGGGGVRAPLFVMAALGRADSTGLAELCLMDVNPEKLALMGALCRHLGQRAGSPVRISTTGDARQALEGARYVVTTLRVGEEQGRVQDERIALRAGVLGQETTGPGGFAMAMRSIPALLGYAELAAQLCPQAWIFNFTNPAGLVTQALQERGFARVIGICDGANQAARETAAWLGVAPENLRAAVFGLNHLSWTRRLFHDGRDILPELLSDDAYLAGTSQRIFDPELVRSLGMWLNEYLFYYYHAERALDSIQNEVMTRGEEIVHLNRALLDLLKTIDPEREPERALRAYAAYERRRVSTYMHYAHPGSPSIEEADQAAAVELEPEPGEGEGYAGVALDIIQALETGRPLYTALNVPNRGAIDFLEAADVVEVSCVIEAGEVRALPAGQIPEGQELLIRNVKRYERLAVESILNRSRQQAVLALMAHPLVVSYSRAAHLVESYLAAHAGYIGGWK